MTAYIFIAEGFEDIEALATADILKRAGINTRLVGTTEGETMYYSSHDLAIAADYAGLEGLEVEDGDALIFPGGMPGSKNLAACEPLMALLRSHYAKGGFVAAICAAPALVIAPQVDVTGLELTCYPGMEKPVVDAGAQYIERTVCVAETPAGGTLVTASGPGFTFDFALNIVQELLGEEPADQVAEGMLIF